MFKDTPKTISDWNRVSLEIATRAYKYSQAFVTRSLKEGHGSGYMYFRDLRELEKHDDPPADGAWWWIFAPLLKKLLDGGNESPAILAALGHHTWVGPRRRNFRREWYGFLSSDWNDPSAKNDLRLLWNLTGIHTSARSVAQESVLLTSELSELLNRCDTEGGRPPLKSGWPYMHPLLSNFTTTTFPDFGGAFPLLLAEWGELCRALEQFRFWEGATSIVFEDFPITEQMIDDLGNPADPIWPIERPLFNDDSFNDFYITLLDSRCKEVENRIDASQLEDMLLGHHNSQSSLANFLRQLVSENEFGRLRSRLLKTVIWFHDITRSVSDGKSKMSHLLTVPIWLPPAVRGIENVSMVVYIRRNGPFDREDCVVDESASCVNAFRNGASIITEQLGERIGRSNQELLAAHELNSPLNVFYRNRDALVSTEFRAACDYCELLRIWILRKFNEPFRKELDYVFSSEAALRDFALCVGYQHVVDEGCPLDDAGKPWPWTTLRDQLKDWLVWYFEPSLNWVFCQPEKEVTNFIAELRFFLLIILKNCISHSIKYAFKGRLGTRLSDTIGRTAKLEVKASVENDRALVIRNLGRTTEPPAITFRPSEFHSQQIFAEIQDYLNTISVEPFHMEPDDTLPEHICWWRTEIVPRKAIEARK